MMAKTQGRHPGATLRKKSPVHFRYTVSARKPKNCMNSSVRYAPTRRDTKRAAKPARHQHTAPVNPRMTPKKFSGKAGYLRLGCRPRTDITFCKSFQTSPFAFGLRSKYAGWYVAMSFEPRKSNHSPRNREMPWVVCSRVCDAQLPRQQITFGRITSIWR